MAPSGCGTRLTDLNELEELLQEHEASSDNNTALRLAALYGRDHIVKRLLQIEAVNTDHFHLQSAIREAVLNGHRSVVDQLLQSLQAHHVTLQSFCNRMLQSAAELGHLSLVQLLVQKYSADSNQGLGSASFHGHLDVVRYLLTLDGVSAGSILVHLLCNSSLILSAKLEKGLNWIIRRLKSQHAKQHQ